MLKRKLPGKRVENFAWGRHRGNMVRCFSMFSDSDSMYYPFDAVKYIIHNKFIVKFLPQLLSEFTSQSVVKQKYTAHDTNLLFVHGCQTCLSGNHSWLAY